MYLVANIDCFVLIKGLFKEDAKFFYKCTKPPQTTVHLTFNCAFTRLLLVLWNHCSILQAIYIYIYR